jgi:sterol desaturase/sphingolipid hydroxylase (fatty acid hydroxylase superfamily)
VWSNDCTGFVDTFLEHRFYFFVWFIIPGPAVAIFAIRLVNQFIGMIGHSGYEFFASPISKRPWPFVCSTYHDLHHSKFNYNYANIFSIWDRLFGTIYPGYDKRVTEWLESDFEDHSIDAPDQRSKI